MLHLNFQLIPHAIRTSVTMLQKSQAGILVVTIGSVFVTIFILSGNIQQEWQRKYQQWDSGNGRLGLFSGKSCFEIGMNTCVTDKDNRIYFLCKIVKMTNLGSRKICREKCSPPHLETL